MPQESLERETPATNNRPRLFAGLKLLARLQALGLSAKLLLLTIAFVMMAEILIFVPSVANFRVNWLNDRIVAARLASLASAVSPGGEVPDGLRTALLRMAGVKAVALKQGNQRLLVLPPSGQVDVAASYDLRPVQSGAPVGLGARIELIGDAFAVLWNPPRLIRVIGRPQGTMTPEDDDIEFVEIVIPEQMLRTDMVRYSLNILLLSIVISLIVAALLYVVLARLLVMPMTRIADNMLHFAERPEDASRIIVPSKRRDEIGTAERELAAMQSELSHLLLQKTRLAQLGLAVAKISHDLRNMLATAQLMSDRLTSVPDPTVQRFAPKLIASLDRAIAFCNDTIRFGRAEEATPRREPFPLAPLVREVGEGLGLPREMIAWQVEIRDEILIEADRDQIYRVLNNLVRNAVQVLEQQPPGEIRIWAGQQAGLVTIDIADDGPGLPAKARANLFQAFQGGARKGGTGLGLAIAAELIGAHGGTLRLVEQDKGAHFRIELPYRGTA
jgi:signal transduction histidine kinase